MHSTKNLKESVSDKKLVFAIYGLGNVGGPIATAWLRTGAKVIGVDVSIKLLKKIKQGISHKKEPFVSSTFTKYLKNGNFDVVSDGIQASKKSDIKIISVPVDFNNNKINFNALISVSKNIAYGLKKNDVIIVCPSLPPGTCRNLILPILEKISQLKVEQDFFLIYNPERIFEGRALQDIEENYPAIVSGYGKNSLDFADNLLQIISKKGTIRMSSMDNAEAEKLFEGVYRDVNIALANELADYCEKIGVNYWEAKKGANSQPFCHLHYPGTGVGGLCIPVYPKFIIESSKKLGKHVKLIEYARKINDFMPKKCVSDAIKLMKNNKKNISNSKIAILGLGFRGDVEDARLSPTYTVVNEFQKLGCDIVIHDPYIQQDDNLPKNVILSTKLSFVLENADLVFVSTDHKIYSKLSEISLSNTKKPHLIFDGRNILDNEKFPNSSLITIGMYSNES